MDQLLITLQTQLGGISQQTLLLAGIGLGVLIVFYASVSAIGGADPASRRLKSAVGPEGAPATVAGLKRHRRTGNGLVKGIVPTDEEEYSNAARRLRNAGFRGENAVRNFYLLRTGVGIVLPALLVLGWLALATMPALGPWRSALPQLTQQQLLYVVLGFVVIGFYGPSFVVKKRIEERQLRISEGFPNALDLMQIAVEAGLGFDAAMNRVALELDRSNPEIAEEFAVAQQEVAAGRDRDKALLAMAQRVGVPEVTSFVTVMLQSMEFGTSVSQALITYSRDMRTRRELKAVEKANKLPVTMSATLVMFMLPGLLCLVLTPIAISWIRVAPFGN